jgi:tRNA (mo5U34)-methyltransferase
MADITSLFSSVEKISENWDISEYSSLLRKKRAELLQTPSWFPYENKLANLKKILPTDINVSVGEQGIKIHSQSISVAALDFVHRLVRDLIPWRKGPFDVFNLFINSEWRSDLKWNRIERALGSLRSKRVLDVGCNNGYYMFRMLPQNPEFVLGIDPSPRFIYQFELINALVGALNLKIEPLGIEDTGVFQHFFDVILCMGVLYHRRDQLGTLQLLANALNDDGTLILETLVVGDDVPYCLCPEERYCMMRNVWFVPSITVVTSWLKKVGLKNIEIISDDLVTINEQRKTEFAPSASLDSFLDPNDCSKTIEGYPAPRRVSFRAIRGSVDHQVG